MKMWKRNTVVAVIVLFVCMAVYLSWSYQSGETADMGKTLRGTTPANGQASDPLVGGMAASPDPASSTSPEAGTTGGGSHFDLVRLNRQQARDSALAILQDLTANESADETMKKANDETIQTLVSYTVPEAQIENPVTVKDYTDCAAFIGDESVSVMVSAREGDFTDADMVKITEIAADEIGMEASQVKITEAGGQVVPEHAVKNQL